MTTRMKTILWQLNKAFADETLTADDFREIAMRSTEYAHDLEYNFDDDDTVVDDGYDLDTPDPEDAYALRRQLLIEDRHVLPFCA